MLETMLEITSVNISLNVLEVSNSTKCNYISRVFLVFLPPTTKLGQGYVFTSVCDSVHRGGACMAGGHA